MASIYKIPSGWRAQVRIKNRPPQSEVFKTRLEAVRWARQIEGEVHKQITDDPSVTFSALLEEYSKHSRKGDRTKQKITKSLGEYWGEYRVSEITTQTIAKFIAHRRELGSGPSTMLQYLVYLGVVLEHGGQLLNNQEALRARGSLSAAIKSHKALGTVSESHARERRPTPQELEKLEDFFAVRSRSRVPMWDIVLFAICTCMRQGEIVGTGGVTWEDFHREKRLLRVRSRKDPRIPGGRTDVIPLLVGPVTFQGNVVDPVEIIERQVTARKRVGRIFPYVEATVGERFREACSKLGIEDLRFHDLRHEGVSRLFEAGFSIPEVARVSGHKNWRNLERYTQIDPVSLHQKTGS